MFFALKRFQRKEHSSAFHTGGKEATCRYGKIFSVWNRYGYAGPRALAR